MYMTVNMRFVIVVMLSVGRLGAMPPVLNMLLPLSYPTSVSSFRSQGRSDDLNRFGDILHDSFREQRYAVLSSPSPSRPGRSIDNTI